MSKKIFFLFISVFLISGYSYSQTWDTDHFFIDTEQVANNQDLYRGFLIDINLDDLDDLICVQQNFVTEESTNWLIYRNIGNGEFIEDNSLLTNGPLSMHIARDFSVADFNGDGNLDVALGGHGPDSPSGQSNFGQGEQTQLWIQDGTGKLENKTASNMPIELGFTHSISAGDLNNDGYEDILIGNSFVVAPNWGARVHINNGDGTFFDNTSILPGTVMNPDSSLLDYIVFDSNKDGFKDILAGRGDGIWESDERDVLVLNSENLELNFAPSNSLPIRAGGFEWGTQVFAVQDFNADGFQDIIASTFTQANGINGTQLCYWENNGDGSFSDKSSNIEDFNYSDPANRWFAWLYPVDLNNDGWMDFCAAGDYQKPRIYINNGDGNFTMIDDLPEELSEVSEILISDLDNDGDQDLIFLSFSQNINILWNKNNINPSTPLIELPNAPQLNAPLDGDCISSDVITFQWNPDNSIIYHLQIALDANFTNIIYNNDEYTSNSIDIKSLAGQTEYFWKVKSINTKGSSDWSDIESFCTLLTNTNEIGNNIFSKLELSPNPFQNELNIFLKFNNYNQKINITLTDVSGNKYQIHSENIISNSLTKVFETSQLNKGIYFLQIETTKGVLNKKIVKL